jgi:hypothetical protein
MEQTLIVSSLARNVTLRCERTTSRVSVRLETSDTGDGIVQWNFFPENQSPLSDAGTRRKRNQEIMLGRMALEILQLRFSHDDIDKVLHFVTGRLVEWQHVEWR